MVFNFFFGAKQPKSPARADTTAARGMSPSSAPSIHRNPTSHRLTDFPSLPSCRSATARRGCPPPSDAHPFFDDPSVFQEHRLSVTAAKELSSMKKLASSRLQRDLNNFSNTKDFEQASEKGGITTTAKERQRSASFGETQPPTLRRQSAMSLLASEDDSLSSIEFEPDLLGIPAISRLPAPRSASVKLRTPPHRRHRTLVSDISRLETKLQSDCEEILYLQAALKESKRRGSLLKPHSTRIEAALTKKTSEYKSAFRKFVEQSRFPDEGDKNEFHPFPRKMKARKSQLQKHMIQKQKSVSFDPSALSPGYHADDDVSVAAATDGGSPAPAMRGEPSPAPSSSDAITPTQHHHCGNIFRYQDTGSVRTIEL